MEHRRFLLKRGLKKLFNNKTEEAELDWIQFHDLVNDHFFLHPLSHALLMGVAMRRRNKARIVEHAWLAACAPIVSIRNVFVQSQR